jgi:hypothetical protein
MHVLTFVGILAHKEAVVQHAAYSMQYIRELWSSCCE